MTSAIGIQVKLAAMASADDWKETVNTKFGIILS